MGRTQLATTGRESDLQNFTRLEDLAEAVCQHLGAGWGVVPQRMRDGSPVDYVPWVATISDGDLVVQLSRRPHETQTTATFGQLHDELGRLVSYDAPSIGFAASKGPQRVAADLRRRLLDPGRPWWARQQERLARANQEHRARERASQGLTGLGFDRYGTRGDTPTLSLREVRRREGVHYARVEIRGADAVHFDIDVSAALAIELGEFLGGGVPAATASRSAGAGARR